MMRSSLSESLANSASMRRNHRGASTSVMPTVPARKPTTDKSASTLVATFNLLRSKIGRRAPPPMMRRESASAARGGDLGLDRFPLDQELLELAVERRALVD